LHSSPSGVLAHGSAFAFLTLHFVLAVLVLTLVGILRWMAYARWCGHRLTQARVSALGMLFAFMVLGSMTASAMQQKRIQLEPAEVMPLQYGVSLLLRSVGLPFQPYGFKWALA
jgi:hypothetical protein